MDPIALAAIAEALDGLETLSRERVGAEMKKLLSAPDPAPAVAAMAQSGVLARILPGADPRALAPLIHLETGCDPDPIRRLAVLGGDDADTRLRLSRNEARRLDRLRAATGGLAELGHRLGAEDAWDALLVRHASLGASLPDGAKAEIARGAAARFPVTARDLMPDLQGPDLGAALARLEALWIAENFAPDKAELLARLKKG